tara:strand:- start:889 stop:1035 length:147 start_codon:yes stop_codon:yes gene_type:complete
MTFLSDIWGQNQWLDWIEKSKIPSTWTVKVIQDTRDGRKDIIIFFVIF